MNHRQDEARNEKLLGDTLKAAFEVEGASPQLRERVAQLAAQSEARTLRQGFKPRRAPRWRFALGLATAAVLLIGLSLVWPRVLTTQALARVEAAMAKVSSVHLVEWRVENGQRVKDSETWFQNGKWRMEDRGALSVRLFANGRNWFYDAKANRVTTSKSDRGPFAHNPSGFTVSALMRDFQSQGSTSTRLLNRASIDGHEAERVLIETRSDYETMRLLLLVDTRTDLPMSGEITVRTRYGKEARLHFEIAYNQPLRAGLFEPKFGGGAARVFDLDQREAARLVDADKAEKDWRRRLSRPISQRKVGERSIILRDLQVNERGSVFLLYSAGKRIGDAFSDDENRYAGRDWKVWLSDSLGTQYHWQGQEGFWVTTKGIAFNGQRLEGDWWVPDESQPLPHSWQPRTFTLRFEVNPKNLHGASSQTAQFRADYSRRTQFRLRVDRPATPVVPAYADALVLGVDEKSLLRAEAEARGELPPGVQPSPQLVRRLDGNRDSVSSLAFSPDGRRIASAAWNSGVRLWDVSTGRQMRILRGASPHASFVAFSPDGTLLRARYDLWQKSNGKPSQLVGGQACLWDVTTGRFKTSQRVAKEGYSPGFFTPGGGSAGVRSVVTRRGGRGGDIWVEEMNVVAEERDAAGRPLSKRTLPHQGFLRSTDALPPDNAGWRVVTSQSRELKGRKIGGIVRVWDARRGIMLQTMRGTDSFDTGPVALAPRGDIIAVGGATVDKDGVRQGGTDEIRLFDANSGTQLRSLQPDNVHNVATLAFSPDGTMLAAEGEDHALRVWEASSGRLKFSLRGHGTLVQRIVFSPDGKMLASGDLKGKIILWCLED